MSKAKMTLIGMTNYLISQNTDIFSKLSLPSDINKGDFKNSLMLRAGEFETLYGDPYFMMEAVGIWGKKWYRTFEKWIDALNIEYAPLENYDRHEDWTETEAIDETVKDDITGKTTEDVEENQKEETTNSGETSATGVVNTTTNTEAENKVSAYNSSVYEPDNTTDTETTTGTTTTDGTTTETTGERDTTGTRSVENNRTEERENVKDHDRLNKRTGRAHGNIGVTTSQQMLQAELDIARWNLYDKMGDLFIQELLIPVYI